MYRKGSPIALIRATDHRRRQAAKANFSLCPTKSPLTIPAGLRLLARQQASPGQAPAGHRVSPAQRRRCPATARDRGSTRGTACSAPCLARPEAFYTGTFHGAPGGAALPTLDAARARPGAGAAPRWPRGGAVGPRMLPAPGAVKSEGHKSAFFPSRSRFRAFPVLSSPRSPPTDPWSHRQAGQRAPIAGVGRRPPFPGEGCSATLVSSWSSAPRPPARLQNHCLTLPKHL